MGVSTKQSTSSFPKNEHCLPPDSAYQGVRNVRFSENLVCFLEITVFRFALLRC